MTDVLFYEKPGCINNTRQKAVLSALGHRVLGFNLLQQAWTPTALRAFFGERPVAQWFNPAAPRITGGELHPEDLDADQALALMLADPLLIRRPLIQCRHGLTVGFDDDWVLRALGVSFTGDEDLQTCPRTKADDGGGA